jgi:hypothetical protein
VLVEGRERKGKKHGERERKRSIWMEPPVGQERDQIKEEQMSHPVLRTKPNA